MECAQEICHSLATGKSKYCTPHKREARARWLETLEARNGERERRYEAFAAIVQEAHTRGLAASEAAVPTPMVVSEPATGKQWYVNEGACGFAWVTVRPGNSSFANYLKKQGLARKAYRGGVEIWVTTGGQSITRKEAYAHAFADVLKSAGSWLGDNVRVYAGSRLD